MTGAYLAVINSQNQNESHHEKTHFLHMRKQNRRSAAH